MRGCVWRTIPGSCSATGRPAGALAWPPVPDVWEVIGACAQPGSMADEAIETTAEWAGLTVRQVRDAVAYYNEYPSEIEEADASKTKKAPTQAERRWR